MKRWCCAVAGLAMVLVGVYAAEASWWMPVKNYNENAHGVMKFNGLTYAGYTQFDYNGAYQNYFIPGCTTPSQASPYIATFYKYSELGGMMIGCANNYKSGGDLIGFSYTYAQISARAKFCDANDDGVGDILYSDTVGRAKIQINSGVCTKSYDRYLPSYFGGGAQEDAVAFVDLNADGQKDILWRNYLTGAPYVYFMQGYNTIIGQQVPSGTWPDGSWKFLGTLDTEWQWPGFAFYNESTRTLKVCVWDNVVAGFTPYSCQDVLTLGSGWAAYGACQ